jgi:CheY-like chemotaxis protein
MPIAIVRRALPARTKRPPIGNPTAPASFNLRMSDDTVRVVVVDDDHDGADLLAELLRMSGYEVAVAYGGLEALDLIEARQPHCVLLDVGMPGMDGGELTERLRARYGDDIVLVAIAGRASDDQRVAPTFVLVDHYLQKPVDPVQLRKLLPGKDG